MRLRWSGNDGFDADGRRVATVARYRDWMFGDMHSAVPGPGKAYWVAFVGNDYVMERGAPGRWSKETEAKAAAESTYRDLIASGSIVTAAPPRPARQRNGLMAFVRDLRAGWRSSRRYN